MFNYQYAPNFLILNFYCFLLSPRRAAIFFTVFSKTCLTLLFTSIGTPSTQLSAEHLHAIQAALDAVQQSDAKVMPDSAPIEIGSVFNVDWAALFENHDYTTSLTVVVTETIEELVDIVNVACRKFKKGERNIHRWRHEVARELATKTVGLDRFVDCIL
jgi:hypothetical protein